MGLAKKSIPALDWYQAVIWTLDIQAALPYNLAFHLPSMLCTNRLCLAFLVHLYSCSNETSLVLTGEQLNCVTPNQAPRY